MATSLHRLHENFIWRLESLTPTHTKFETSKFLYVDPFRIGMASSMGLQRRFWIQWNGSEEDSEPTDMWDRVSRHSFDVNVVYFVGSDGMKLRDWHELVAQDRHDICKELRRVASYVGYDADNTATDIGLISRVRSGDEIQQSDSDQWVLRLGWDCLITESEG